MKVLTKALALAAALLLTISSGCSRNAEQVTPPPPEVDVATVTQRDIPVMQEAVATLDGFSNANINAQVQGYLIASSDSEAVLLGRT